VTGQYLDELEVEVEGKQAEVSKLDEVKSTLEAQGDTLRVEVARCKRESYGEGRKDVSITS
jgi:hypothetical protein